MSHSSPLNGLNPLLQNVWAFLNTFVTKPDNWLCLTAPRWRHTVHFEFIPNIWEPFNCWSRCCVQYMFFWLLSHSEYLAYSFLHLCQKNWQRYNGYFEQRIGLLFCPCMHGEKSRKAQFFGMNEFAKDFAPSKKSIIHRWLLPKHSTKAQFIVDFQQNQILRD